MFSQKLNEKVELLSLAFGEFRDMLGTRSEAHRLLSNVIVDLNCASENDKAPLGETEILLKLENCTGVGVKPRVLFDAAQFRCIHTGVLCEIVNGELFTSTQHLKERT